MTRLLRSALLFTFAALLTTGCGDHLATFSMSGFTLQVAVTGVTGSSGLILIDSQGAEVVPDEDGKIYFASPGAGAAYEIAIKTHPEGKACTVKNGKGVMPPDRNLEGVEVSCSDITVEPAYPNFGRQWNRYVKFDGADILSAKDVECPPFIMDTTGYHSCINGGEIRQVSLPGLESCDGITASDSVSGFSWVCDASKGTVRVASIGFKGNAGLANFIDFDNVKWKAVSVSVLKDGAVLYKTKAQENWWSQFLSERNSGGMINTFEVAIATVDPKGSYQLMPQGTLVVRPNAKVRQPLNAGLTFLAVAGPFTYLEGDFDASMVTTGIILAGAHHAQLRNLRVQSAMTYGIRLDMSRANKLSNVTIANSGTMSLLFWQSPQNLILGLNASNNNSSLAGFTPAIKTEMNSSDNTLASLVVTAGGNVGVELQQGANSTAILGATVANHVDWGVRSQDLSNGSYTQLLLANNGGGGLNLAGQLFNPTFAAADNQVYDLTAVDNGVGQINSSMTLDTRFQGALRVGGFNPCTASGPDSPGLIGPGCTQSGAYESNDYPQQLSDAKLYPFGFSGKTFVGKVETTDSANSSNFLGTNSPMVSASDWTNFENPYRAWGREGMMFFPFNFFPQQDQRGACLTIDCRIWDWSLSAADEGDRGPDGVPTPGFDKPLTLGRNECPSGNVTLKHQWSTTSELECHRNPGAVWYGGSSTCKTSFLPNALEIDELSLGNHNGFCESGEVCLVQSNSGAYQGHGSLVVASSTVANTKECQDIGSGGAIQNVKLMKYSVNGY